MSQDDLIRRYDNRYPGVDISDAQTVERQQRIDFKSERRTHGRTGRNRGIIVPELPWRRNP
jgi:hypothetical protein